jgi:glycosyltransferase involved in cell wall biosynthesis
MNIAFFSHNGQLQGAPLYLAWLAGKHGALGHACTVFSAEEGPLRETCESLGVRFVVVQGCYRQKQLKRAIWRAMEDHLGPPDLCIVNTILGYHLVPALRKRYPNASVGWVIHESQFEQLWQECRGISPEHFAMADRVIFVAERTKELYQHLDTGNFTVIPAGIPLADIDEHREGHARRDLRERHGIHQDAFVFLIVGTLTPRKGQHEFVKSALQLLKVLNDPRLTFVIVGDEVPGERYLEQMYATIASQGKDTQSHFHFVPARKDIFDFFGLADAYVCNSFVESFPLVVLEAMAFGLPVISSATYGTTEQLEDGRSGLLITPGSIDELTKQMYWVLQHPEEARTLGENAHKRVHALFSLDRMLEQYQALFPVPAPLREPDQSLTKPYRFFRWIKRQWIAMGRPFPEFVHMVRHQWLGPWWPVAHSGEARPQKEASAERDLPETSVGIIIPCHNYGHFLAEAIKSALSQTFKTAEIIVVDDSSTDDTAEVAARYADRGVRYYRGDWRAVGEARNFGLAQSKAEFLVFLDADDVLHPHYVSCGLHSLRKHKDAAIAYSDQQCFGRHRQLLKAPQMFDWRIFDRGNFIHAASMVRREALAQAGGFTHGVGHHGDWVTWRRILALGWQAVRSEGMLFYRKHESGMFNALEAQKTPVEASGLLEEPTTFCLSLSGRGWAWPQMSAFLARQTFPHDKVHLILLDTSQGEHFGNTIREWISRCDYGSITYLREAVGPKGLADLPRDQAAHEVSHACAAIYNRFARIVQTPLVLFLEDDVIPPHDVFTRLALHLDKTIFSVSAAYRHRTRSAPVAWHWNKHGNAVDASLAKGTESIGGNGFGCLLMRGEYLRHTVFRSGPPYYNFDHHFYAQYVRSEGGTALIDWDCRCRHYSSADAWVEPS